MIKKTSAGYKVTSEAGKNLSADNLSKEEAEERLAQVERFKHMDKWANKYSKTRGRK